MTINTTKINVNVSRESFSHKGKSITKEEYEALVHKLDLNHCSSCGEWVEVGRCWKCGGVCPPQI